MLKFECFKHARQLLEAIGRADDRVAFRGLAAGRAGPDVLLEASCDTAL